MSGGRRPVVVLCVNAGSSSLKVALDEIGAGERRLAAGDVQGIGTAEGRLSLRGATGHVVHDGALRCSDHAAAVAALLEGLAAVAPGAMRDAEAAGHRVVHGGPHHAAPALIDDALLDDLRRLTRFAPLHQPAAIAGVEAVRERLPRIPQVACFDTAFHRRMPEIAQRLPLPASLWDDGVQRYGFHGLSYEWMVSEVRAAASGRAVIAHLGNGASLAAVRDGDPVDTTMGFSPAGGLMMGTRAGDLDPGVPLYLLSESGYRASDLDRLVNRESGLLGVSGSTSDMRALLQRRAHDPAAARAVAMFCLILRKHIGAMAAAIGGVDTLIFTGGIGEHAAPVRAEACRGLGHLGVAVDAKRNAAHAAVISRPGSACTVRVVATNEDRMIARHTARLVSRPNAAGAANAADPDAAPSAQTASESVPARRPGSA